MGLQTFQPAIHPDIDPHSRLLFQLLFNVANNHAKAIVSQNKAAGTTNITNITETAGGGVGPSPGTLPGLGGVNNQTGQTAYTTTNADGGILLILNDASPIAVTLNSGVSAPWMCFVTNQGTAAATLTPSSGTITYPANPGAASMPLLSGYGCLVAFDGTNWFGWTMPVVPVDTPALAHEWLSAYNAVTGAFTQTQPDFTDLSGTAAVTQIPNLPESKITNLTTDLAAKAPIASPTFTGTVTQSDATVLTAATTATSATAGAATALPATPDGYLSVSINGSTKLIPYFNP